MNANEKNVGILLLLIAGVAGAIALYLRQDVYVALCIVVALLGSWLIRHSLVSVSEKAPATHWKLWLLASLLFLVIARLVFVRGQNLWLLIGSFCGFAVCLAFAFWNLAKPTARDFLANVRKIFGR